MIFNEMILAFGVFEYNLHSCCRVCQNLQTRTKKCNWYNSNIPNANIVRDFFGFVDTNFRKNNTICKTHKSFHASGVGVVFHRLCATRKCHISLFSQMRHKFESRIEAYVKVIKTTVGWSWNTGIREQETCCFIDMICLRWSQIDLCVTIRTARLVVFFHGTIDTKNKQKLPSQDANGAAA